MENLADNYRLLPKQQLCPPFPVWGHLNNADLAHMRPRVPQVEPCSKLGWSSRAFFMSNWALGAMAKQKHFKFQGSHFKGRWLGLNSWPTLLEDYICLTATAIAWLQGYRKIMSAHISTVLRQRFAAFGKGVQLISWSPQRGFEKAFNAMSSPLPPKSKRWLCIIMRWQVYHLARLIGKVIRFQHRGTHWWVAAPLYQKQRNRSGLNNWLDCLACGIRHISIWVYY